MNDYYNVHGNNKHRCEVVMGTMRREQKHSCVMMPHQTSQLLSDNSPPGLHTCQQSIFGTSSPFQLFWSPIYRSLRPTLPYKDLTLVKSHVILWARNARLMSLCSYLKHCSDKPVLQKPGQMRMHRGKKNKWR